MDHYWIVVDTDELLSLAQAGVVSINTAFTNQNVTDAQGNQHLQVGSFTTTDGQVRTVTDVWFATDRARTVNTATVAVDSSIAALPGLPGFGNLASLRQVMQQQALALPRNPDGSLGKGELQVLVETLLSTLSNVGTGQNLTVALTQIEGIMLSWSGASNYSTTSRGSYINGQHLYAVEAFLGQGFVQAAGINAGTPLPGPNAALLINQMYAQTLSFMTVKFLDQTLFKSVYDSIILSLNTTNDLILDVSQTVEVLRDLFNANPTQGVILLDVFGKSLLQKEELGTQLITQLRAADNPQGTEFDLYLSSLGANRLIGDANNNRLSGTSANEVLAGLAGTDSLYGYAGNDVLTGGTGNDYLVGGAGADTYQFSRGDGQDTINNWDADTLGTQLDNLQLAAGIAPTDVTIVRDRYDLLVKINGTADQIRIQGFANEGGTSGDAIDKITFADGAVWNIANLMARINLASEGVDYLDGGAAADIFNGLGGNDIIRGNGGNDTLLGGMGNDSLYGGAGDDVITGGAGNDALEGGSGSDTYHFARGDGQDTIDSRNQDAQDSKIDTLQYAAGIAPSDVLARRLGTDLVLSINSTSDKITVLNYFNDYMMNHRIDEIKFADATVWTYTTVQALAKVGTAADDQLIGGGSNDVLNGLAGNDRLEGWAGNDVLDGGSGNDVLIGGQGSDIYLFGRGYGQDSINNSVSDSQIANDTLRLVGLNVNDVSAIRINSDLVLGINGSTDKITVQGYFYENSSYQLKTIEFSDGTQWERNFLLSMFLNQATGTAGNDQLQGVTGVVNHLYGLQGNDSLYGVGLDDLLDGGVGDDNLTGGGGNDVLEGGIGNDALNGGAGNDVYLFNLGDGRDRINNYDNSRSVDTLQLGIGLTPEDTQLSRTGNHLILTFNSNDQVQLDDYFYGSSYRVSAIVFSTGAVWDYATVARGLIYNGTAASETLTGMLDQANRINGLDGNDIIHGGNFADILNGGSGNDTLNGNLGADALTGGTGNDTLNGGAGNDVYSFNLGDGQDIISDYDHTTGNVDTLQLGSNITTAMTQLSRTGNALILTFTSNTNDSVRLNDYFYSSQNRVENISFSTGAVWDYNTIRAFLNNAPTVNAPLTNQSINEDAVWSYVVPSNTFADRDAGDSLSYSATKSDGTALPVWLSFNSQTRSFRGTPTNGEVGSLSIKVTARDLLGATVSSNFTLTINNINDAPVVANPIASQQAIETQAFSYTLPANTFADVDVGDRLTLMASLVGGSALPSWLAFNPTTGVFSGTPSTTASGTLAIQVKATDNAGAHVSTSFNLQVINAITGTANAETLIGTSAKDILYGLAGNDTLNGGAEADTLIGGLGNDTYIVDNIGDAIVEAFNEGTDLVQSTVGYTLGANLENLTLTGTSAINGTGNELANILTGNTARNTLTGGAGDDLLIGGGGADAFNAGAGRDVMVLNTSNLSSLSSIRIDGGSQRDTLKLDANVGGQTLNLTTLDNAYIKGVEVIDITGGGNNILRLNIRDMLAIHDTDTTDGLLNRLLVQGNAGDKVELAGDTGSFSGSWSQAGTEVWDGVTYNAYVNASGLNDTLLIMPSISAVII